MGEDMKILCIATCLAAWLVSGCASYSGSSLVAGKSTAAEVEALMGKPAERVARPDGGSVLYYPRGPAGRETHAVSIGADGKVQSVDQRLTDANIARLVRGTTSAREVRELFGPPATTTRLPRLERDVWEYPMDNIAMPCLLLVQFSGDGIVREVFKMKDYSAEPPSGKGKGE
jgi:outer membrane protein assembly factor BamE (lipoprotein component of BamABCDE complex)